MGSGSRCLMDYCYGYTSFILIVLFGYPLCYSGTFNNYTQLFDRQADHRISSASAKLFNNKSVEDCARHCVQESGFHCQSFDYQHISVKCLLYEFSVDDPDVNLIPDQTTDHYRSAYLRQYHRLPHHGVSIQYLGVPIEGVSAEGCGRRCYLETQFVCQGFQYMIREKVCQLTDWAVGDTTGLGIAKGIDFYQKIEDSALEEFINYGSGQLRPMMFTMVYEKAASNISIEDCASHCMKQTSFTCRSFDYLFAREHETNTCRLSQWNTETHGVLQPPPVGQKILHYERRGAWLRYFYVTPYALLLGQHQKMLNDVTTDVCAKACLEEAGFICRSFDYQIVGEKCTLSSKTGSDVGGLTSPDLMDTHHFEMRPMLDCGGNLTASSGWIASPNWPRNYTHQQYCVWNITVSSYKVVKLTFSHLQLADLAGCSHAGDRVVVAERLSGGLEDSFCVLPEAGHILSRSNSLIVYFFSNGYASGQGFRAHYQEEWTCDVTLKWHHGEFASPNYPEKYGASQRCTWKLYAPQGYRISLRFIRFDLDPHVLGHCTRYHDHVQIHDGMTTSAPQIGLYCGRLVTFTVKSTGRDMLVQFMSDKGSRSTGFHAVYNIEKADDVTVFRYNITRIPSATKRAHEVYRFDPESSDIDALSHRTAGDINYKTMMWAALATLIALLLIICVIFVLVWRYFRKKVHAYKHRALEADGDDIILPEEMPLQPGSGCPVDFRPNNEVQKRLNTHNQGAQDTGDNDSAIQDYSNEFYKDTSPLTSKNVNTEQC